jgi:hypothetical protein
MRPKKCEKRTLKSRACVPLSKIIRLPPSTLAYLPPHSPTSLHTRLPPSTLAYLPPHSPTSLHRERTFESSGPTATTTAPPPSLLDREVLAATHIVSCCGIFHRYLPYRSLECELFIYRAFSFFFLICIVYLAFEITRHGV